MKAMSYGREIQPVEDGELSSGMRSGRSSSPNDWLESPRRYTSNDVFQSVPHPRRYTELLEIRRELAQHNLDMQNYRRLSIIQLRNAKTFWLDYLRAAIRSHDKT